ncbi:MFS transporter [Mycolicibacterium brumae]|uniref:MFS transporter n=1 Tax=Mycolicibacterium brumae TaxID=85968 RepID=A0A2G5PAS9_9MYCO|nr:MFS transporter [Mycolicibacterium brumae]MCV7192129.1 MFS transporter [Mycolicibacterium brumae]PIB75442.1 MFS transporter [Mycolicibacterium brumae]
MTTSVRAPRRPTDNPWYALWAMMVGFFMILVDSTIVAVANDTLMESFGVQGHYDRVIWVTSAYLLAYAVPLLVAGRLGDRYGPKNLYLLGLFVFTAASLWCGLADSLGELIAARVVQGLGAAMLTPQTLSTITKIFPAHRRGVAMSVWGATAGVATLVGPLAGGVIIDHLGWSWIFFVNVPIGVIGLAVGLWLIPTLPTERHRLDLLGVLLSGLGMFLMVFGLQEGQAWGWSPVIWLMILGGIAVLGLFVYWQSINQNEPLMPLRVFRDPDFSLSAVGVAIIGFAVTAMVLPVYFYAQQVLGLSPTGSALLTAPMAVVSGLLAPWVGRIIDRAHPTPVIGFGFAALAVGLTWLSIEMTATTPPWRLVPPFILLGAGMAFIWAPLAATATRRLPPDVAGAGSGVYNATRQVGSVLGSAAMAALISARIHAELPRGLPPMPSDGRAQQLPEMLREPFAAAYAQSLLLPAFIALFGVVAALFLADGIKVLRSEPDERIGAPVGHDTDEMAPLRVFDDAVAFWRDPAGAGRPGPEPDPHGPGRYVAEYGEIDDDDGYIEYLLAAGRRSAEPEQARPLPEQSGFDLAPQAPPSLANPQDLPRGPSFDLAPQAPPSLANPQSSGRHHKVEWD